MTNVVQLAVLPGQVRPQIFLEAEGRKSLNRSSPRRPLRRPWSHDRHVRPGLKNNLQKSSGISNELPIAAAGILLQG